MMNTIQQNTNAMLSPKRVREKADILETNLFKSISKQPDPSKIQIKINRANFPDPVINKALLQLMPRHNIKPRDFLLDLRDLLMKDIPKGQKESFKKNLNDENETLFDDSEIMTRTFEATASKTELEITVRGVPAIKSIHGEISKSFFAHELSPGKLLKDGVINFKEINKYPIVNSGDNLFYITHEKQGKQGISFDGKVIPVEEARPFIINIGTGVKEIDDPDETGTSRGYFLQSQTTGVVALDRNEKSIITGIDISEEVEIKRLDYSTGNIGSQYTCPIRMKIGVICNGFKLRVNGKVETTIVDGGEIITNNEAIITKTQSGSTVMALKDISIDSATHSKIISECGIITINKELIDSEILSPKVAFEKNKGLITNNKIETENLSLNGLYFSGENVIYFGNNLFVEKEELIKSRETIRVDRQKLSNMEKVLMGKLQLELKRMAKLTIANNDLVKHIKPIIIATNKMDYDIIFREMDLIQKRNNTKVVSNVRKLFEALEKIPQNMQSFDIKESSINESLNDVTQRMSSMKLSIEGYLRRAATIKIFCGNSGDKEKIEPDFMVESDYSENKLIKITGTYSQSKGFEFIQ